MKEKYCNNNIVLLLLMYSLSILIIDVELSFELQIRDPLVTTLVYFFHDKFSIIMSRIIFTRYLFYDERTVYQQILIAICYDAN